VAGYGGAIPSHFDTMMNFNKITETSVGSDLSRF
jgi:hypothetical protein